MSTEIISGLFPSATISAFHPHQASNEIPKEEKAISGTPDQQDVVQVHTDQTAGSEYEKLASQLKELARSFNQRLDFSISDDTGQVVVKVIDGNTDKVIRELPPEEVRRLYKRIKDAIGLLFNEVI